MAKSTSGKDLGDILTVRIDTVGEFVLRRKWERVPQAASLFLLHRYFRNSKLHVLQRNSPTVSRIECSFIACPITHSYCLIIAKNVPEGHGIVNAGWVRRSPYRNQVNGLTRLVLLVLQLTRTLNSLIAKKMFCHSSEGWNPVAGWVFSSCRIYRSNH